VYQRKRSLVHLQIFEDAPRGSLGAMLLVIDRLVLPVASLGALITILALAFDPFVQQGLICPVVPVSSDSASLTTKQALAFFTLPSDGIPLDRAIQGGSGPRNFNGDPPAFRETVPGRPSDLWHGVMNASQGRQP